MNTNADRDNGSAAVEAAIVFPVLLLLGLLLFAAVHVMTANGQVDASARAGARAAATGSSAADARQRAVAAVSGTMGSGSSCQGGPDVTVIGFAPGQVVTVTVTCTVNTVFHQVLGDRQATGSASERVSEFRGGMD